MRPWPASACSSSCAAVAALAERRFGAWGGLLVGTARELTERFAAEAALGAELFVLQFHDFATPETLAAFARDVMPRFG